MIRRASIKDVAVRAGVSYKTVSRVVNDVPTVDAAIRARVRAAIEQLHYVPSTVARSLKAGAGSTIGLLVDSIDDVFFAAVASTVEDRALALGLGVVIASTGHDAARERDQLLRLASGSVRGVVLAPVAENLDYFDPHRSAVPLVAIDRRLAGHESVTVDDYGAALEGMGALLDRGHDRVGLIGWDPSFATASRRRDAYVHALAERGIGYDPALAPAVGFDAGAAVEALDRVLALPQPPTALFLSNARHAAAVVGRLHEVERTDLALMSFGDFLLADAVRPSISCIDQDPYEIAAVAVDALLELIDDPDAERRDHVLATRFIPRQSHLVGPRPAAASAA